MAEETNTELSALEKELDTALMTWKMLKHQHERKHHHHVKS